MQQVFAWNVLLSTETAQKKDIFTVDDRGLDQHRVDSSWPGRQVVYFIFQKF